MRWKSNVESVACEALDSELNHSLIATIHSLFANLVWNEHSCEIATMFVLYQPKLANGIILENNYWQLDQIGLVSISRYICRRIISMTFCNSVNEYASLENGMPSFSLKVYQCLLRVFIIWKFCLRLDFPIWTFPPPRPPN